MTELRLTTTENFLKLKKNFRGAVAYDPDGSSTESRTAQLFLARTLHSEFAGNRQKIDTANQAIEEYKKALTAFLDG